MGSAALTGQKVPTGQNDGTDVPIEQKHPTVHGKHDDKDD